MKISQFARERGVEPQAVSRYIARHPEIQRLCEQENGRIISLSPEAEALLGEKYPIPQKPFEIVQGVPQEKFDALQEKYSAALERLTQIQEERLADQRSLAAAEATKVLLEDRETQLQKLELRATAAEEATAAADRRAEEAEKEIERLRSRGLWARIRNL